MSMKISQREARALRRRVRELEEVERQRRMTWSSRYPGGTHFRSLAIADAPYVAIATARKLGHAVVVTTDTSNTLHFYALPSLPEPPQ